MHSKLLLELKFFCQGYLKFGIQYHLSIDLYYVMQHSTYENHAICSEKFV